MQGKPLDSITPEWRPFQLAFLLMNLPGIARPSSEDRKVVDLLFFPTGGGKTEAYLGLAACTLVLRRMQNPGIAGAGVSVLMRYTLRLLTLDQLGRAATLICALELERLKDETLLGSWPFEIGLWVGRAATPNRMGRKGDNDRESARARTIAHLNDDRKPSPIPLEECPWCGTKFKPLSFKLLPNPDDPTDLRIRCVNRSCEFGREVSLPILAVDDPIYRRLPCFIVATVDKFAGLPWVGQVGAFFGRVTRYDAKTGFFGPCDTAQGAAIPGGRLLTPDLVIQDELHLISGPLGTMVGLYETALEAWKAERQASSRVFPGLPYVALHGFSHLLLTAVALECGYPASSIRERIYAIPSVGYGVLLYTKLGRRRNAGRTDPGRPTYPQFGAERSGTRAAVLERSGLRATRSSEQAGASAPARSGLPRLCSDCRDQLRTTE